MKRHAKRLMIQLIAMIAIFAASASQARVWISQPAQVLHVVTASSSCSLATPSSVINARQARANKVRKTAPKPAPKPKTSRVTTTKKAGNKAKTSNLARRVKSVSQNLRNRSGLRGRLPGNKKEPIASKFKSMKVPKSAVTKLNIQTKRNIRGTGISTTPLGTMVLGKYTHTANTLKNKFNRSAQNRSGYYVEVAKRAGAKYFNVKNPKFFQNPTKANKLPPQNRKALDRAISRGDRIRLSSRGKTHQTGIYKQEIKYLQQKQNGYKKSPDGKYMIPTKRSREDIIKHELQLRRGKY